MSASLESGSDAPFTDPSERLRRPVPPVTPSASWSGETLLFAGLRIAVDDRVLRPRPWTELQARWAAELAVEVPGARILELCSGAGHIGLAAAALANRDVVCVDVDPFAASLTASNARANALETRVEVRATTIAEALGDRERSYRS